MKDAILCLSDSGEVEGIVCTTSVDSVEGVEFYSGILVPGMVNAHCHLELSYLRDAIPEGGGFSAFGSAISRERNKFDMQVRLRAAELEDARLWQQGVGAVGDICNDNSTFGIKQRSKIRYTNFIEIYGLRHNNADTARGLIDDASAGGLYATPTPHSTYSLDDITFRRVVNSGDGVLSIHFMESESERELYSHRGPMWEWYRSSGFVIDFEHYGTPASRIMACIPPERKLMLVHNTFVTEEEVQMLQVHFGSNLTWVLCPRSNHFIERSSPPVAMLRRNGCRIALGTDSLASNRSLSMAEEMFALGDRAELEEMLRWATEGGAQALGLNDTMGSFERGKRPGVVLVSGADLGNMRITPQTQSRRIV